VGEFECPQCCHTFGQSLNRYVATAGAELGTMLGEIGPSFWLASVHRVAGGVYAFGLAAVLYCWVGRAPLPMDIALVALSTIALFLLNSVDAAAIVGNPRQDIRQKATVLIGACYVAMFVQISGAAWSGRNGCTDSCCTSHEVFYGFCVIMAATCMRFIGVAFDGLWSGNQSAHTTPVTCCAGNAVASVTTAITGAMFFVMGLSLQVTATVGTYGSSTAMIVPMIYIAPMPLLLIVRAKLMTESPGQRSSVWLAWSQFLPAAVYIVALSWPWSLGANGHLTPTQTKLCYGATIGIVLGTRLGVHALEVVSVRPSRYSSVAFEMF